MIQIQWTGQIKITKNVVVNWSEADDVLCKEVFELSTLLLT